MNINELQLRLEDIYEINTAYNVERFIFSNAELARHLDNRPSARDIPEKLLVREHDSGLDISLYLDQQLLANLDRHDPLEDLQRHNLADFCHLVEGVSHFIYLVWNAGHGRQVTQLELEIQAEIDKYVTCVAVLAQQGNGRVPNELFDLLFENVRFDAQLKGEELKRYVLANEYAKRYCRLLHDTLLRLGNGLLITKEIRRFYRLLKNQKIERINNMTTLH